MLESCVRMMWGKGNLVIPFQVDIVTTLQLFQHTQFEEMIHILWPLFPMNLGKTSWYATKLLSARCV